MFLDGASLFIYIYIYLPLNLFSRVQKLDIDNFSGYRIYPSKGKLFVRGDSKVEVLFYFHCLILTLLQIFRFASSKNASLFLQRKNPRKIAWTQVYRRMHKKGITEEVAKKRSRKTVKHQRGIVGADLAAIAAKRNQTTAVRQQQRLAAITKAKSEKKEKENKKEKEKAKVGLRFGRRYSRF